MDENKDLKNSGFNSTAEEPLPVMRPEDALELVGRPDVNRVIQQLEINNKFLLAHIDRICEALAPGKIMTWQDRVKDAAILAERLRWRYCIKEPPVEEVTVLLFDPNVGGDQVWPGHLYKGEWHWENEEPCHPTLWMPIPHPKPTLRTLDAKNQIP